jgi:hypothetical protein
MSDTKQEPYRLNDSELDRLAEKPVLGAELAADRLRWTEAEITRLRAEVALVRVENDRVRSDIDRIRVEVEQRTAERDTFAAEIDRLRAEVAALKANDPLADYQEQVASIVYAAMRFDREDVTPEWQCGNSHAEYRAQQAATEIAEMLRCALKAHDPLAEMWRELAEYQPQAYANSYGICWMRMCEERTRAAAADAANPSVTPSAAARAAARAAAGAAAHFEEAMKSAADAIAAIRRAKEAKP